MLGSDMIDLSGKGHHSNVRVERAGSHSRNFLSETPEGLCTLYGQA